MEQAILIKILDQGFDIILLCIAVYYMHKKVEKVESQKEQLVKDLLNLHLKTAEVLDKLSDKFDQLSQKLDNIIKYESVNKRN